jgi:hypothetical protein
MQGLNGRFAKKYFLWVRRTAAWVKTTMTVMLTGAEAGQFCKILRQTFRSERIKNSARVSIQVCGEKNQTGSSCSRPEKESLGDTFFHRAIGCGRSTEKPDRDYNSDSVEDRGAKQIGDAQKHGVLVKRRRVEPNL